MTGKARSPTVYSRVGGTFTAEVDDDRRRCRPGIPATGWRASDWSSLMHRWDRGAENYEENNNIEVILCTKINIPRTTKTTFLSPCAKR